MVVWLVFELELGWMPMVNNGRSTTSIRFRMGPAVVSGHGIGDTMTQKRYATEISRGLVLNYLYVTPGSFFDTTRVIFQSSRGQESWHLQFSLIHILFLIFPALIIASIDHHEDH